jgi:hypothetical protein
MLSGYGCIFFQLSKKGRRASGDLFELVGDAGDPAVL